MIIQHNPYPLILQELFIRNEISEETMVRALKATQRYVIELRRSYRNTPCSVNYEDKYLRAAYMLAYFPYYIETVHRVLDFVEQKHLKNIFNDKVSVCFYGAGPAPELLGLLSYIDLHHAQVNQVFAYLFDAATQWETCREICMDVMAPHYWCGSQWIKAIQCNMLECVKCKLEECNQIINRVKLHIMQNCLNDMVGDPNGVIISFRNLFAKLSLNSLFIIIDLKFNNVRDLLKAIGNDIERQNLGFIVKPVYEDNEWYRPLFDIPEIILENVFDNGPETVPRRYTRYHSLILMRR